MLEISVRIPLQHTNTMLDRLDTFLGTGNGELDHGSSLIRAQLVGIALVGDQCSQFHGHKTSTFSLNQGKIPELEIDIVCLAEVVIDTDFSARSITVSSVLQDEEGILAVLT